MDEKILSQHLQKYSQIKLAYLFGSQARRTARRDSDVDLAVLLEEGLSQAQRLDLRLELMVELSSLLRKEVDVVVLNEASLVLAHQVLKEGRLVYCVDEEARYQFAYKTIRDYLDTAYLRRVQEYYLYRRIDEGKFGVLQRDYQSSLEKARKLLG